MKSSPLLRVQLGEHHEGFLRWCANHGRDPTGVVRQLVGLALSDSIAAPHELKPKVGGHPPRLRVQLGDSHGPFIAWCEQRQVCASTTIRQWILQMMHQGPIKIPGNATTQLREVVGTSDASRVRVVLRLSQSEVAAWGLLALERKEDPNKLMRRVLRSCLTKTIGFSPEEASLLGTHNLLLLRACNHLSQLAKRSNASLDSGGEASIESERVLQEVAAVRAHVAHVSALLSSNRERWLIESERDGVWA